MANNFKKIIDRMMWVPVAPAPIAHAAGSSLAGDLRSDQSRNPNVFFFYSPSALYRYNTVTKAWGNLMNPATGGSATYGMACVFAPSAAIYGTLSVSSSSQDVFTIPSLPTTAPLNSLANRGGSGEYGYKIRLVSKSTGKTEERYIVANTAGSSNITITVDTPFTFTPTAGDVYEMLHGALYLMSGGTSTFVRIDVALTLKTTLTASGTTGADTGIIALDEQYTPYDCHPGEGMIKGGYLYDSGLVDRYALEATAATSNTITGQATGGDYDVVTNEYRNFQIRIVEDTTTPAAVGQRRVVQSNTAGGSPVYTLVSAWTTTPSANAKYVIELPNIMLMRTNFSSSLFVYNYGFQTYVNHGSGTVPVGVWSTSAFSSAAAGNSYGSFWAPSWGIRPDPRRNARHSFCHFFRGGSTAMDTFDLTTGTWTSNVPYDGNNGLSLAQGSCGVLDPTSNEGRMVYINRYGQNEYNVLQRFDVRNLTMSPFTAPEIIQTAGASGGARLASTAVLDGTDVYSNLLLLNTSSSIAQELLVLA